MSQRTFAQGLLTLGLALVAAAAVGCTQLPPPTPLDQLNPQQAHGYQVYQQNCARCHSDRTNAPLNGPSLRSTFKKQYLDSGAPANDDRVLATILYGRGMMPAVGRSIPPQDRDDLLAYLHTL